MAQSKPVKLSVEQVLGLVQQLSPEEQAELRQKLALSSASIEIKATPRTAGHEVESWLDANLSGDLDAYEWATAPVGSSVQYVNKVGFVVSEELA